MNVGLMLMETNAPSVRPKACSSALDAIGVFAWFETGGLVNSEADWWRDVVALKRTSRKNAHEQTRRRTRA